MVSAGPIIVRRLFCCRILSTLKESVFFFISSVFARSAPAAAHFHFSLAAVGQEDGVIMSPLRTSLRMAYLLTYT